MSNEGINFETGKESDDQLSQEVVEEQEYEVEESEEVETEDDAGGVSDEEAEPTPKKQPKKLYTSDEIKQILRNGDFSTLDTSRLSEEGKAVMRAMQAGLTPKLQESSELRRELAEMKEMLRKSAPQEQPKDIYEAFDRDPEQVMSFVNNKIREMIHAEAPIHEIEKLREVRESLRERKYENELKRQKESSQITEVQKELLLAVPDIKEKEEALTKFAIDVMGYTMAELVENTHIGKRGLAAVNEIKRINTAYEKFNTANRAKAKEKPNRKPHTEKPGDGFQKQDKNQYQDLFKEAKQTGNWEKLFLEMGT